MLSAPLSCELSSKVMMAGTSEAIQTLTTNAAVSLIPTFHPNKVNIVVSDKTIKALDKLWMRVSLILWVNKSYAKKLQTILVIIAIVTILYRPCS